MVLGLKGSGGLRWVGQGRSGVLGGWAGPEARRRPEACPTGLTTLLLRYAFDPAGFARFVLGWTADEKQADVLRTTKRRVILNCSRQWGKSTLAAAKILHVALTRPGALVLVVSENLEQTAELFGKLDFFLARLGIAAKGEPGKRIARRIGFNGSRILGLASREAAGRGYTADFVLVDEAARIDDDVIDSFKPTILVKRGDWWMASTPKGRRGRFFQAWQHAMGPDLLKVMVPASENPRIPVEFVEECRQEQGENFVRQEFECEFIENGTNLLSLDQVDRLVVR